MAEDLYDLKDDPDPRSRASAKPARGNQTPSTHPSDTSPPAATLKPASLAYEVKTARTEKFEVLVRDFYAPMVLLAGGIVVEFGAGWLLSRGRSPMLLLRSVGEEMVIGTAFLLVGVILASKLKGIAIGDFWLAVWKLCALSVSTAAVSTALMLPCQFLPFGGLIAWLGGFIAYFALLGFLFELDQEDTWFLIMVIFLVKLAAFAAIMWIF